MQQSSQDEEFSYCDYLVRQGVYSIIGFGQAKLLSHDRGNRLLARIYAFWETGTAHIVAISG